MELSTVLDVNLIKTNLKASSKEEAIGQLTGMLLEKEVIKDKQVFENDVYERERIGQTGIGNFIAIPHGKSAAVVRNAVAIGVLNEEIPWETLDGKGVKVIVLFAVGNDTEGAQAHLKLLSLFARKLGNDEVVEQLLKAVTATDVLVAFE